MLAATAEQIGTPLDHDTAHRWSVSLGRLSVADDGFEQDPTLFDDPKKLLAWLEITPYNDDLIAAAQDLVAAAKGSEKPASLEGYIASRTKEAIHSFGLLRYQCSRACESDEKWQQLQRLSVFGMHIDTLIDARSDAKRIPFTAFQIAQRSLAEVIAVGKTIEPDVYRAFYAQLRAERIFPYIATLPVRRLLARRAFALGAA